MINNLFVSNEYISIFSLRKSNVVFFVFFLLSQTVQILKTDRTSLISNAQGMQ